MPHPGGIQRLYRPRADLSALAHRKWMPSVNVTGDLTACATHWLQFAETDVTLSAFHVWHSERPAGAETWLQPLLHRGTTFTEQLLSSAASLSLSLITPRQRRKRKWGRKWPLLEVCSERQSFHHHFHHCRLFGVQTELDLLCSVECLGMTNETTLLLDIIGPKKKKFFFKINAV